MRKAIIIGAGPAGLTAAYELLKKSNDIKPIILEESNGVIGGISQTVNYKNNRMDIGGHRFFTKDDRVNNIWLEIMPIQGAKAKDDIILNREVKINEGGPDPEKEDIVMLKRHRISRIYFLRKFFDYPISLKFKTFKNMGFKRTMKAGFGYIGSCLHKRKEINLENFYINRFGKPLYQMFFEDYTTKVWGVSPKNISADWGRQRVKGLSLTKAVFNVLKKPFVRNKKKEETSLIQEFLYPKKGPGQLYEEMAKKIIEMGGEIIFNSKVDEIKVENNSITYVKANNIEYRGDYYFSSMPIKDLIESIGKDNVSSEVYEIATNLPYRDFITVGLLIDKFKIKNETKIKTINNIVPDTWIYVQDRGVHLGRIQIFNNWSPYMVEDLNKIFIGLEYFAFEGDEYWNMEDKDFIDFAIKELIEIGVIESKENVLDSVRVKIKKAYPAYFGTYKDFDKVKQYLNTISNLYCVGRNGQHRYNNMDHSMLTSLIAVDNILNNISDKENLWNVNTEQSYHETKEDNKK